MKVKIVSQNQPVQITSEIHKDTKYNTNKGTLFRFFTILEGFFEFYYSHMNLINPFVAQQIRHGETEWIILRMSEFEVSR